MSRDFKVRPTYQGINLALATELPNTYASLPMWGYLYDSSSTTLSDADPLVNGALTFNNATPSLVTGFAIPNGSIDGTGDPSTIFISQTGITQTALAYIWRRDNPIEWALFKVTAITNQPRWQEFTAQYIDSQTAFTTFKVFKILWFFMPSGYQPLDSDLTAIAALSTTSFGRALLTAADAAAVRSAIGTVIGTDVEAHDADLTTIAGLSPSNDDFIQRKSGAWANRTASQAAVDLAPYDTKNVVDSNLTVPANYSMYYPDYVEISNTFTLEIASGASVEIG